MNPPNTLLGKILQDDVSPVVMVVTTPLAEQACGKNGLTFVQMLSPFAHFHNLDIPVRTASDQPYRLQSFRLRMVYASDVRQQDPEMVLKRLREVISCAIDDASFDLHSGLPKLEDLLSMSETEVLPSWFSTFNRDLSQAVSFSDHEAFDHPVACLVVVSSQDEQPMKKFANPLGMDQLPSLLKQGLMDPNILKCYLLLHDKQDGSIERATGTLTEMRNIFGFNECIMLTVNSDNDDSIKWKESPWAHCKTDSSGEDVDCLLSMGDLHEMKEFMQDLSSKKIIPYMEQKIRLLNQQVVATRKGFRNQIKNLWWRKGKEDSIDTPGGPVYTSSSAESQIRVLGDYAFMLRDYELALSNYRLLSTDYKLDKAWKRYAGVQEMMALTLFMLDQSRKDSEYFMETAFNTYLKLASGSKNATRCGIWWAEMLKARGQHKEAAGIFFRISQEEPSLHAAVLLEQASYCYLLCGPPMLRKFGFHLILAGNRYYNSEQRKHAILAYKSALAVYRENSWSYISDHVHFNIGRWYAFLEMFDAAVQHMLEILECTHQSMATQDLFLKDFLHVVKNMGKKPEVAKLQLPSINASSLKVIFEDHRIYASSAALNVRESIWQTLEEDMAPSVTVEKLNWLESRKFHTEKKEADGCVSLIGEAIRVFLEIKNPLRVPLSVSGISLVCELCTKVALETDKLALENGYLDTVAPGESSGTRDQANDISSFELSEIDFILEGGETKEVQLNVIPKIEGFLKIVGVKWTLSRCVVGYHYFDFDSKRKNKKGGGIQSSPRNNLAFIVVKGLPRLEGYVQHMPDKTYNGNLQPLMLELRNQSEYSVKNMKMKISHPRFLIPGNPGTPTLEFPGCLEKQANLEERNTQINVLEKPGNLFFSLPTGTRIHGGAVFQWPLWLHSAESGKIFLYLSIYYEMEDYPCDMNYRMLRMYYELEVLPSLDVAINITPCTSNMQEFLVRMEIMSNATSESFWLHQLSSIGGQWEISSLPTHAVCPSQLLLAGQALVSFFKLKDRGETSSESKSNFQGSDMQLGSDGDSKLVLDVSRTPLVDFHLYERSHQERHHQVTSSTVDFILVSQLVDNDANPEQASQIQLLSHHACQNGIVSKSPVWCLMDGPRTISHDFSTPFCEASFFMMVRNCSDVVVSLRIVTFDAVTPDRDQSTDASPFSDASGWYDVSLANDVRTVAVSTGTQFGKQASQSITPFIWCASSSNQIHLEPMSTAEVPLRICLFSPGIYDLSNYELRWSMQLSDATEYTKRAIWQPSGVTRGHPFFLTVLHSATP